MEIVIRRTLDDVTIREVVGKMRENETYDETKTVQENIQEHFDAVVDNEFDDAHEYGHGDEEI